MHNFNLYLDYISNYFSNPYSRLHWLYLASSLVLALGYFYVVASKKTTFKAFFFPEKIIQHPSTRVDIYIFFLNAFIKTFLLIPFVFSATYISKTCRLFLENRISSDIITLSDTSVIVAYTISLWLIADLTRYLLHYTFHSNKYLWEFHKTHHSPEVMTPITQYRIHPFEQFLFFIRNVLVTGIITGVFKYFFFYQLDVITIIGVNAGRFIFLFLGSNLRHSHIPLRFGTLIEHIFISPAQHQIHHGESKEFHNKNMGSQLAIWDWIFGTLKTSKKDTKIKFGIGMENNGFSNLKGNLLTPFKNLIKSKPGVQKD